MKKKRSDWLLKCIDIFPVRAHIIVSLIVFCNFVKPPEHPTEGNGIGGTAKNVTQFGLVGGKGESVGRNPPSEDKSKMLHGRR